LGFVKHSLLFEVKPPRWLGIAWRAPVLVVSHGKFVLPWDLSGTLKFNLGVGLEKRTGLKETQSICGFLNNVDIGKPLCRAEPRDKLRVLSLMF
jgi:hypothetical protein